MSVPTRYMPSVSMVVLGADGGGGAVTVTDLVISRVDVSVTVVWLDPPQPARTIAAPAIEVAFPCIAAGYAGERCPAVVFAVGATRQANGISTSRPWCRGRSASEPQTLISVSCRVPWFGRSPQSANGPSDTGDARENFAVRCCTMGRTISATCDDTAAWCGTADGYTNHRCRGERCTAANVARN